MILSDHGIIAWATQGGIEPFYSSNVQPASIDISVGKQILVEERRQLASEGSHMKSIDLSDFSEGFPYYMDPGDFAVVMVAEKIDLSKILVSIDVTGVEGAADGPFGRRITPPTYALSAKAYLKSSRAREGLELLQAGWAEAGYVGNLSLAMRNARRWQRQPLWPGRLIAQLVLHAHRIPMDQYNGHYQNAGEAQGSWDAAH